MKYKHIIWDWNGTLLDDAWLCVEVLNYILKKRGRKTTGIDTYRKQFSFPVKDYYIRLGFNFSVESFDQIANEYIAEYNRRRFECQLHKGATEILDFLKDRGINQSILSAYHQDMLEEIVDYFKLTSYFNNLAGLNDYYASGKVHIARRLLDSFQIDSKKILLIGDTIHDFEVAEDIGADCVLLSCGHQNHERLTKCRCKVIDSTDKLQKFL